MKFNDSHAPMEGLGSRQAHLHERNLRITTKIQHACIPFHKPPVSGLGALQQLKL